MTECSGMWCGYEDEDSMQMSTFVALATEFGSAS